MGLSSVLLVNNHLLPCHGIPKLPFCYQAMPAGGTISVFPENDYGPNLWEFLNLLQETKPMAKVADYYSVNEANKPADKQVYHDNDQCRAGRDIPQSERRPGRGGY